MVCGVRWLCDVWGLGGCVVCGGLDVWGLGGVCGLGGVGG